MINQKVLVTDHPGKGKARLPALHVCTMSFFSARARYMPWHGIATHELSAQL